MPAAPAPAAFPVPVATDPEPAVPAAPATPAVPAAPAQNIFGTTETADGFEESDDDLTIVVRREARWGLELPDGDVLELMGHDVVVGRRPEPVGSSEALKINDPTRTLSKSHARMRRAGEEWTVEDLHSTNGVSLIDETGASVALEPGHERGATERMLIGTLEVRLVQIN